MGKPSSWKKLAPKWGRSNYATKRQWSAMRKRRRLQREGRRAARH